MYYSIMGLSSANPFENEFRIEERDSLHGFEYIYPGDGLLYSIDNSLNDMYDLMLAYVFGDTASYYDLVMNLPMICDEAGYSPEVPISNDNLNAAIQRMGNNSIFGREMLLVDLQFLIGSINNLVSSLSFDFINFYMYLSRINFPKDHFEENTIFTTGHRCGVVFSSLTSYFTKAYSILDITAKLAYEFEHDPGSYKGLTKLRSKDVLFGSKKGLSLYKVPGTIFEVSDKSCISIIESLRNELVHNGTWDLFPKIYCEFDGDNPRRKYIYWPDFSQGHLACSINRKRFFSSAYTTNEALVAIHLEFLNRLAFTIDCMLIKYKKLLPKRSFEEATGFSVSDSTQQIIDYYNTIRKEG